MSDSNSTLPKGKQTALGLYVTADEAFKMWQADPEKVIILDVRTPEEFLFVGYPTMAWKIPVIAQTYEWDAEKSQFPMKMLPDFVSRVSEVAQPGDLILATCRSGGRSAIACNLLAKAGFTNVYSIVDGIEGDSNGSSESTPQGGWKNSDCPWTKKLTPERMLLPTSD
ncbi:rhodanese-like domain-containing protein [Rubritalea sp.]|uniref:rhodanese-like domain-containing protein n=1 Tax=Rubritalea sp. TaxID=2109375 RepID=UPI003EF3F9AA